MPPPQAKAYKKADGGGLYLEVMPNGARYWRLKYRFGGKGKRLACGVYPDGSLAKAREKRTVAKKMLADGIDPSAAKRGNQSLSETNSANTFEAIAREWHERNREKWPPNYALDILHRMDMDIFPILGKRPVADITPMMVLDTLRPPSCQGCNGFSGQLCLG